MLEYKLPQCDQQQICLSRFASGRANITHLACGRVEGGLQYVTVPTAFSVSCEAGSVSRAGRNPAPIKQGSWRKTFFWCLLLPAFLLCSLLRTLGQQWESLSGVSKSCYQKLDAWHPYWSPQITSVEGEMLGGYENNISPA